MLHITLRREFARVLRHWPTTKRNEREPTLGWIQNIFIHAAYLQLILLPINNNRRDLLIHEYQYRAEQRGQYSQRYRPPFVAPEWRNHPTSVVASRLKLKARFERIYGC